MKTQTQNESPTGTDGDQQHLGAVLYTDGSCKYTNPGHIGWGMHGYLYKMSKPEKPTIIDGFIVTNDGYVPQNDRHHASRHEAVEVLEYLDFFGSSLSLGTNNLAEIQALTFSLERLGDMDLKFIDVYTDSEYVRKGITDWCKNWEKFEWRKQDGSYVTNHDWWIRVYGKYKELLQRGISVRIHWVKGHNDVFGNTHADILAGIGTNYSLDKVFRQEFKFSPARGYWKQEIEKHPFLNFKRVYFNSVDQYNLAGHYFQADTGGADLMIGKRIPETGLAVVKLKQHEHAIEEVKKRQYEVAKEQNAIIMMKLDRVYSKEVYPYIQEHGKYCLLGGGKGNLNINFFDKKPVTVEVNPTGLSMRAIESFNLLEELLDRFLTYRENGFNQVDGNIHMNAHDVTSVFYDKEEKEVKKELQVKYILKPEFVVGYRDMSIDIEEPFEGSACKIKVPLILGTDLLPRNNLKKLEDQKPTVYLVTWRETRNSIRYATVIECETGIGIWSNFFADKIFFKPTKLVAP